MDKENLMLVEFTKSIGGLYEIEMIAIYNQMKISENEVRAAIKEEVENENIIIVTKKQYENVFRYNAKKVKE